MRDQLQTMIYIQIWDGGSHCFKSITISYQGKTTQAQIVDEVRPKFKRWRTPKVSDIKCCSAKVARHLALI